MRREFSGVAGSTVSMLALLAVATFKIVTHDGTCWSFLLLSSSGEASIHSVVMNQTKKQKHGFEDRRCGGPNMHGGHHSDPLNSCAIRNPSSARTWQENLKYLLYTRR